MLYAEHLSERNTPQSEQDDPRQVRNNAGGFSFQVDDWARLQRFLILGSEGGSYYAKEGALTRENAKGLERCLRADPKRAVDLIVDVSHNGRAPKNDPAIFALALGAAIPESSKLALLALPSVCRTGTHLFQFVQQVNALRGWGTALRRAVASWYEQKNEKQLLLQLTKYRQRGGMSHRDVFRLSHPRLGNSAVGRWVVRRNLEAATIGSKDAPRNYDAVGELPEYLAAFDELQHADESRTIELIRQHRFTHEMIPTEHRNSAAVWEALLDWIPLGALVRNLGKLSSVGLTAPMSDNTRRIAERLQDQDKLREARMHPLGMLVALKTYQQGHGEKGDLSWAPEREIVDALDAGFYASFGAIAPSGKRMLLALDVSGSMCWASIAGMAGITPRIGSAAMAMATAKTEKNWHCFGFSQALTPLNISPRQRLDDVISTIQAVPMGGTDCALPMLHAAERGIPVDLFVVYTDSETWFGHVHPHQALTQYREKTGIPAKLAVVGMVSNGFTIADPSDAGMLDVVGFDTATPNLLSEFASW